MKYMILVYGSQNDYDAMAGQPQADGPAWSGEDFAAMGTFMESFSKELTESGELVDTQGLSAPVHARRIRLRGGAPVVTDGPYAETEEVLAGVLDRRLRELRPRDTDRREADQHAGTGRRRRPRRG